MTRMFQNQKFVSGTLTLLLLLTACGDAAPSGDPGQTSRLFLPTDRPENVTEPTVETDAQGGLHLVYAKHAVGDAFYAYCAKSCASRDQATVVRLKTDGTVTNAMLALDRSGRPHVLLDTLSNTYYATCAGDCTGQTNWTTSKILEHGFLYQVTGEAFALDPQGRPRFLLHGWVGTFGPNRHETFYVTCDRDCHAAGSWTQNPVAPDQTWYESQLRFTAQGQPRVATVTHLKAEDGTRTPYVAYLECDDHCAGPDGWAGGALVPAYLDKTTKNIDPAVSMALTRSGAPRVWAIGREDSGKANLVYFACDANCADPAQANAWKGTGQGPSDRVSSGLDLALDAQDRPRAVYNLDDNIFLASCNVDCASPNARWQDTKVELTGEMKADGVIPYPNCTVAAWFLRHPSVALDPGGKARVAYQALDVSGGVVKPDPSKPPCSPGVDMTLGRLTLLP